MWKVACERVVCDNVVLCAARVVWGKGCVSQDCAWKSFVRQELCVIGLCVKLLCHDVAKEIALVAWLRTKPQTSARNWGASRYGQYRRVPTKKGFVGQHKMQKAFH